MQVKENIISWGHGYLSPSYVCIHETANPGATALNHVNYWQNDDTYAVHYVMDWSGIAYHCVPDDRICWQVGNGNPYVIGIELCHATNLADFVKVWTAAVEWAAWMLKRHGWGVSRLISHDTARRWWGGSDHTDPLGYFAQYGKTWDDFCKAVSAKMKGGELNKQNPGTPINDVGFKYRSQVQHFGWLDAVRDGQMSGTTGNGFRLEALKITPPEGMVLDVKAHISGTGWKTYKGIKKGESSGTGSSANDPIIGTVGQAKGLEAIEVDVVENPGNYKLDYRVHVGGHGWGPWVDAGYCAGTTGIGKSIECVQFRCRKS